MITTFKTSRSILLATAILGLGLTACGNSLQDRQTRGAVLGGVAGAAIGSLFGKGSGQVLAVGAGAVLGSVAGANIAGR